MKRKTEALNPDSFYIDEIKKSKERVFPDIEELADWYDNYANNHINRLSFDLQYLMDE